MDNSISETANKVGATIAEQVSALSPQPRSDNGRFEGKAPPIETRSRYEHPMVSEDAIHEQLLGLVQNDGTPEQWQDDPVKAEMPAQEVAPAEEQAAPEVPALEIDYEAPLFETKVKREGGEEEVRKLSLKELQSGYMRQEDYTRKTQEVAKAREQVQAEVQQYVGQTQQAYQAELAKTRAAIIAFAAPELKGVDWVKLSAEDPAEFVRLSAKANQVKAAVGQIDQQLQAYQQQAAMQEQQMVQQAQMELQSAVAQSIETLQKEIPNWSNEVYSNILKGGEDYGFSREELGSVHDARVIKLLHDAQQYRQLQKAKPEVAKKVVAVPKVMRPGTPQGANPQAQVADKAAARLAKTGKLQDAAALFLARGIK